MASRVVRNGIHLLNDDGDQIESEEEVVLAVAEVAEFINLNSPRNSFDFEDENTYHFPRETNDSSEQLIEPDYNLENEKLNSETNAVPTTKEKKIIKRRSARAEVVIECSICKAKVRKTKLKKHIRRHTKEGYLECDHCGKKFESTGNLRHHIRTHTGEKPFKCEQCSRCFAQLAHLQGHLASHSDDRPFSCWMCGKQFKRRGGLRSHMNSHTGKKRTTKEELIRCHICDFICKSKYSFTRHQVVHVTPSQDIVAETPRKRTLKNRNDLPFKCTFCKECFVDKYLLKQHEEIHIDAFRCLQCNKPFEFIEDMKKHEKFHKELEFCDGNSCKICNEQFLTIDILIAHVSKHIELRPYECHICNKPFKQRAVLRRHYRIHSGIKPFTCDICDKSFNVVENRNRHRLTHNNENSHAVATPDGLYLCSTCPAQFKSLSSLVQHRRSHANTTRKRSDPPYKCHLCKNAYRRAFCLQRHLDLHEGIKHKCPVCDKSFSQIKNLKLHQRVHTDEKPYTCSICPQTFRYHSGVSQHMKTHKVMGCEETIIPDLDVGVGEEKVFSNDSNLQFPNFLQPTSGNSYEELQSNFPLEDVKPVIISNYNSENLESLSNSSDSEDLKINTDSREISDSYTPSISTSSN